MQQEELSRWDRDLLFRSPEVCPERAKLFTESYKETEKLPAVMRLAKAFEKTLAEMTIYIQPKHLIVGNLAAFPVASPIWPEFGMTWVEKEIGDLEKRQYDKFIVSEDSKNSLKDLIGYWKDK
jgi:pyruvate-formate lyase